MIPDQWYIDGCLECGPEDEAKFDFWTSHLPSREDDTPLHSGSHSVRQFRNALAIAGLEKKSIFKVLEVGFCLGHSAEIFYRLGAASVTSIEISERAQTLMALNAMMLRHGPSFQMIKPGQPLIHQEYDFGFIDGDHSATAIRKDVETMLGAKVPWVLFDDFWPHWGDTQQVMQELGIMPVAILGTMALCDFR